MTDHDEMRRIRAEAASLANADDASVWRWFALLLEQHRIRWCLAGDRWIVSVNNTYAATDRNFDQAIRLAKQNVENLEPREAKKLTRIRNAAVARSAGRGDVEAAKRAA